MMKDEEKLQQQRATDQTLKGRREEGPKNETGEQQESLKAPHNHIGWFAIKRSAFRTLFENFWFQTRTFSLWLDLLWPNECETLFRSAAELRSGIFLNECLLICSLENLLYFKYFLKKIQNFTEQKEWSFLFLPPFYHFLPDKIWYSINMSKHMWFTHAHNPITITIGLLWRTSEMNAVGAVYLRAQHSRQPITASQERRTWVAAKARRYKSPGSPPFFIQHQSSFQSDPYVSPTMHLSACESCHYLLVLCVLLRSCRAFRNDATELLYSRVTEPPAPPEVQSNVTLNRARNGGRGAAGGAHDRGGEDRRRLWPVCAIRCLFLGFSFCPVIFLLFVTCNWRGTDIWIFSLVKSLTFRY